MKDIINNEKGLFIPNDYEKLKNKLLKGYKSEDSNLYLTNEKKKKKKNIIKLSNFHTHTFSNISINTCQSPKSLNNNIIDKNSKIEINNNNSLINNKYSNISNINNSEKTLPFINIDYNEKNSSMNKTNNKSLFNFNEKNGINQNNLRKNRLSLTTRINKNYFDVNDFYFNSKN